MKKIPVAFSTDDNFLIPAYVSIGSMLKNADQSNFFDIIILCSKTLSENSREYLKSLQEKYSNCLVRFLSLSDDNFPNSGYKEGITVASMFRLMLASLLPEYDKCLYLDTDILVLGDITQLYEYDIRDTYIGAVRDSGVQYFYTDWIDYAQKLGIASMRGYFNSGILVMNLERIRKDDVEKQFLQAVNKAFLYKDQDILNICCENHVCYLPLKYNVFRRFFCRMELLEDSSFSHKEIVEASEQTVILHFAEGLKPWDNLNGNGAWLWWEYAQKLLPEDLYQSIWEDAHRETNKSDWSQLFRYIPHDKSIAIFGFSRYGKEICHVLHNLGYQNIEFFCDNSKEKQGLDYEGISVVNLDSLVARDDLFWINSSQRSRNEVRNMLINRGYRQIWDYIHDHYVKKNLYYAILDEKYYKQEMTEILTTEKGISYEDWDGVIENDWIGKYHLLEWWLGKRKKQRFFPDDITLPELQNKIVFMTFGKYMGHGKYIAEEILRQQLSYDIVWMMNDDSVAVPDGIRKISMKNPKTIITELMTAKIWISDVELPEYLQKRKEQIYIQTKHWASVTLKKFYLDAPTIMKDMRVVNYWKKDFSTIDYMITGSDFDTTSCRRGFAFNKEVWQIGSPRTDAIFRRNECKKKVCSRYHLSFGDKVLLYAPTYRFKGKEKANGMESREIELDYDLVKKSLEHKFGGDWKILLRLHPAVADASDSSFYSDFVINASHYEDAQELVAACDVMISDYSSIMFEPAFVGKPVFLFTTDYEDYIKEEYDLLIDMDQLPFQRGNSNHELCELIEAFDEMTYLGKLHAFFGQYGVHEDGKASYRAVENIKQIMGE